MNPRVVLFSALLHSYIGLRLVPALMFWPWAAVGLAMVLLVSAVLLPAVFAARRRRLTRSRERLAWAGYLLMGLLSSLFVFTFLRDILLLFGLALRSFWPDATLWHSVQVDSAILVPLAALTVTALGLWNARRTASVVPVDVPIADLPRDLHGFTIAQISDVHVGPTIKRPYVQAIVDTVNALKADMIAVTGDLVDGSVAELAGHVAPLGRLSSRHGTFFVTGNHEYYSGVQPWISELSRLHMRVLMNEHVVLRHGQASLVVAGVADPSAHHFERSHRSDPHAAIAGAPQHASIRVLLAHQPRSAPAAAEAGFDLQLSGHTHGGQFFPWNLLVRLQQPFTAGLHRLRNLWVYTSRGTGYWGPPKRVGAPSEITLLRLVPAVA